MFNLLFLLFVIVPIIEISLLIQVGDWIGGWNTIGIIIITALIGAHLVRQQGLQTLMQAQRKMQQGEMPGQEMAEGLLLAVAGVLLVTPGFVTDFLGLLFAFPGSRTAIARKLMARMVVTNVQQGSYQSYQQQWQRSSQDSDIIEGEFERKDRPQRDKLDHND